MVKNQKQDLLILL